MGLEPDALGTAVDSIASVPSLWKVGRAKLAALASKGDVEARDALAAAVLVFDRGGLADLGAPQRAPRPGELAKHKLLDLVGDLTLYGVPPRGRLRAVGPGHTVTHRAMGEAMSLGIVRVAHLANEGAAR